MKFEIMSFPQSMFSIDDADNMFITEASDLGNRHFQPLSETLSDRGFVMETTAGEKVVYVMEHIEKDDEGDILYWLYSPLFPHNNKPQCTVFND